MNSQAWEASPIPIYQLGVAGYWVAEMNHGPVTTYHYASNEQAIRAWVRSSGRRVRVWSPRKDAIIKPLSRSGAI